MTEGPESIMVVTWFDGTSEIRTIPVPEPGVTPSFVAEVYVKRHRVYSALREIRHRVEWMQREWPDGSKGLFPDSFRRIAEICEEMGVWP